MSHADTTWGLGNNPGEIVVVEHWLDELLFPATTYFIRLNARDHDLSSDGQRFLMLKDAAATSDDDSAPEVILVKNWFEELTRLVPVN